MEAAGGSYQRAECHHVAVRLLRSTWGRRHSLLNKLTRLATGYPLKLHPRQGQKGLTLLEVLVAIGILGLVGPVFLMSIVIGFRSTEVSDAQIQAEALARTQLETIKESAYLDCNPTPCYTPIADIPSSYTISINVQALDDRDGDTCENQGNCNTLQDVTVSVFRPAGDGGNKRILTVSGYKMKR